MTRPGVVHASRNSHMRATHKPSFVIQWSWNDPKKCTIKMDSVPTYSVENYIELELYIFESVARGNFCIDANKYAVGGQGEIRPANKNPKRLQVGRGWSNSGEMLLNCRCLLKPVDNIAFYQRNWIVHKNAFNYTPRLRFRYLCFWGDILNVCRMRGEQHWSAACFSNPSLFHLWTYKFRENQNWCFCQKRQNVQAGWKQGH